ncbi:MULTISPECIES: DUF2513 domain-containing protein [Pseudomonas]|uniref:DUF2513 domain-containing protein n=1 Tax=Pseudomonas TaxID=286 RepID=UPI0004634E51|nr:MULTISPECIES: DUF2513 domain-containing protein [Pseudomonas]MCJ2373735.1 DUF2513 domain-containing protein [Pseudomonas sp. RGM 3321]
MKRDILMAARILGFLVQECVGTGVPRNDIRLRYVGDKVQGVPTEVIWDQIDYHLELLESAGFVARHRAGEDFSADIFSMTWAGHDYLDQQDF